MRRLAFRAQPRRLNALFRNLYASTHEPTLMKRLIALAAISSFCFAFTSHAQTPNTGGQPRIASGSNVRSVNGDGIVGTFQTQAERDIDQYEKVVTLTDEQKRKIKDIYAARDRELQEFQASVQVKLQAQQAALNEAARNKDQKGMESARKEFMSLFAPQQDIIKRGTEALKQVLTPEQREKAQEHRFMTTIASYAPGVQLTEAQLNLLKIASTTGSGELEGYEGVLYELLNKTLTAEQTRVVLKHRVDQLLAAHFRNVNITPEQRRKIDARIELMLEHHPRTTQLDGVVFQKLREYVGELLTAEQKEALKFPRAG